MLLSEITRKHSNEFEQNAIQTLQITRPPTDFPISSITVRFTDRT
jgi:hypothetical protein